MKAVLALAAALFIYTNGIGQKSDKTPPTVTSINRQSPTSQFTNATSVIFRVTFSETVTGVDYTDFTLTTLSGTATGTISSNAVVASGRKGNIYDVTVSSIAGEGTLRLDLNSSGTNIKDAAGNAIQSGYTAGQTYIIDQTRPAVLSINRQVPTTISTTATSVTFRVTFSEKVTGVDYTDYVVSKVSGTVNGILASTAVTSVGTDGTVYDVTVSSITGSGTLRLDLKASGTGIIDVAGNAILGGYTSGQTYDVTGSAPPTVISINRQVPLSEFTNVKSVTFRVTFSVGVTGVDYTDFTTRVTGTVKASISRKIATIGTTGSVYDVTLSSISGEGTLGLNLNSSGTNIKDAAGNAIQGGYTVGQSYTIDHVAPSLASVTISSNNNNPSFAKAGDIVTLSFTSSEAIQTPIVTIATHNASVSSVNSTSYTASYTMTSSDASGKIPFTISYTDLAGNSGAQASSTTNGSSVTFDKTDPAISRIVRETPLNAFTNLSSVTFRIAFTETVSNFDNTDLSISNSGGVTANIFSTTALNPTDTAFDVIVDQITGEGILGIVLNNGTDITDVAGNNVSNNFSGGQTYTIDQTAPTVVSIDRQSPLSETTSASTVIFRTTFSEAVNGVDVADFVLTASGASTGTVASVSSSDNLTYDITVNAITGAGTLRLDLKASGTGITDNAGNPISGGFTNGETYTITVASSSFASVSLLNPVPIFASTGEKPQSKVWHYNGYYWAVLANASGTYLYRLDGASWTSTLKLSNNINSQADCKMVGSVTHILLYQGTSSQLVSVEYNVATNSYQLWSARNTAVSITLDAGVETATIDIDGSGRMWIASAGVSDINVRWSDAPYSTWSSPVTIATGVNDDDICDVIYMPVSGKIGVLWSNQNTQRFGFKTHADGADPSTWSSDEVPASQSAINFGAGMADDHLNFALASDGTLYCAVKTSYDATGYPKVALLIRRPNGAWDNLYEVSQTGTRGIVVLNEAAGKLKVIYTSQEFGGDILYKETSTSNISFGSVQTLISGVYNDATSAKENYSSDIVVFASNSSQAVSVLASDNIPNTPPATPVLLTPANGATDISLTPTLNWSAAQGATSYEMQLSTASDFSDIVSDQNNLSALSASVSNLANNTVYYWRVQASNSFGSSAWSSVFSFTTVTQILNTPLVGYWKMDEGSGTQLVDASGYGNHGTTVNNPVWTTGVSGLALQLNGSTQYATVPNSTSLNPTTAITLSAWIKPARVGTQYIIKKALIDAENGYELSLGQDGFVFFRINQVTSANTYRVNSTIAYPTDGNTWMHIAGTYDGSVLRLYINGVENAVVTPANHPLIATNTSPLSIGAQSDGINRLLGAIDEARVYNTALTASDIAALATPGPASLMQTAGSSNLSATSKANSKLSISPNPVVSNAIIKFVLSQSGAYSLRLYDSKGMQVSLLKQGEAVAGEQIIMNMSSSGLASGLYIVRLQTAKDSKTMKIIVQR